MDPQPTPQPPVLEFAALRVEPAVRARRGGPPVARFDLRLAEGEILAATGESGAGKSLLCTLALGALPAGLRRCGGTVLHRGRDLFKLGAKARERLRAREIVRLGAREEAPFPADGTVAAALEETRRSVGLRDGDEEFGEALHSLGLVEIEGAMDIPLARLPALDLKRLWLLRALLAGASVLVLDDPFADLDPAAAERFGLHLRELAERRRLSVLLATGRPRNALGLADRLAILFEGRVLEQGGPEDLLRGASFRYAREFLGSLPPVGEGRRPPCAPAISPEAVREAREHLKACG